MLRFPSCHGDMESQIKCHNYLYQRLLTPFAQGGPFEVLKVRAQGQQSKVDSNESQSHITD